MFVILKDIILIDDINIQTFLTLLVKIGVGTNTTGVAISQKNINST